MKKSDSRFQQALGLDRRRYQEQHGDDATIDIIQDAARHGQADYLLFLAKAVGIDFAEDGKTALFWLAGGNELAAVRHLIDAGASVQSRDGRAASPLMHAARRNQLEMARLLCQHGARVDFRDGNGDSALSVAKEQRHSEMVALLESLLAERSGS
jgi:uncharacterized protein